MILTGLYKHEEQTGQSMPSQPSLQDIEFQATPGTIMLIHFAGAHIHIEHIKAFNEFMDQKLRAYETNPADFNHSCINRVVFSQHWEAYAGRKGLMIESPYDVIPSVNQLSDARIMEWYGWFYHFAISDEGEKRSSSEHTTTVVGDGENIGRSNEESRDGLKTPSENSIDELFDPSGDIVF